MNAESKAQAAELKNMMPAALLVRCSAIAVDLCLVGTVCTVGFALMSIAIPADSPAARSPIALILLAACAYIGWGRNRFASAGRMLFRLQVARVAGPSGMSGRMVTVYTDAQPVFGSRAVSVAVGVIISCALISALALSQVLGTTTVFSTVKRHTQLTAPFAQQYGTPPVLSSVPNALLIGERHAYVQIGANWGEQSGLLDYYLLRHEGRWQVQSVHHAREQLLAKYTLKARDEDIPKAPQ